MSGQVASVTDPSGHVVSTVYDPLGRQNRVTDPAGVFTRTMYTKGSRVVRQSRAGAPNTTDADLVWTLTFVRRAWARVSLANQCTRGVRRYSPRSRIHIPARPAMPHSRRTAAGRAPAW